MSNNIPPFHLAFPVKDLEETYTFYTEILGCRHFIEQYLCDIINKFIRQQSFTKCLKIPKVIPLFKKGDRGLT